MRFVEFIIWKRIPYFLPFKTDILINIRFKIWSWNW